MDIALKTVYALLCGAGIAIDVYSMVCYVVGHRRAAPSGVPLAGLILYVLAGMWRSFMHVPPLVVQWELLGLVGLHVLCHVVVPLADRALLKLTRGTWGRWGRKRNST